jgi:hypothetical protein
MELINRVTWLALREICRLIAWIRGVWAAHLRLLRSNRAYEAAMAAAAANLDGPTGIGPRQSEHDLEHLRPPVADRRGPDQGCIQRPYGSGDAPACGLDADCALPIGL